MAFLLPVFELAAAAVAEVGAASGAVAAEVTGSELAGAAASNAAKGAIGGAAAEGAKSLVSNSTDAVFGPGASEKVSQTATQAQGTFGELMNYGSFNNNYDNLSMVGSNAKQTHWPRPTSRRPVMKEEPDFTIPTINSGNAFHDKPRIVQFDSSVATDDYSSNQQAYNLVKLFNQEVIKSDPAKQSIVTADSPGPTFLKVPALAKDMVFMDNANYVDPRKIGMDLGTLLGKHAIEMASNDNKDPVGALKTVSASNPALDYLVPKVNEYTKGVTLPTDKRFQYFFSMYNGRNITPANVTVSLDPSGLKMFKGLDERGQAFMYKENPKSFKVPTLNGVWTGPNSPNNNLPTNLLDTFSYFHDVGYHENGWFDLDSDLIYVSRLYQNLDRFTDSERLFAKFAINYFSTVGNSLALYKNSLGPKVANQVVKDKSLDDIMPKLVPGSVNQANYNELRYAFYNGIVESLRHVEINESPLTVQGSSAPMGLKYAINNLSVEMY